MNLRPHSYQRHFRAALSALETPSLTSAAVLGSVAWVGTAIPAAALLNAGGSSSQSDMTMSLRSALLGIHDNAAGFGLTTTPIVGYRPNRLPTLARLEALRDRAEVVVVHVKPIVVTIEPAATPAHAVPRT